MRKKIVLVLTMGLIITGTAFAQDVKTLPEYSIQETWTSKHMNILAADEMMGRKPGHDGNLIAGRYIAEQFKALGLKPANNGSYFQNIGLETVNPPKTGSISTDQGSAEIVQDFILRGGDGFQGDYEYVKLPYAWVGEGYDDYKGVDVKGKIVVAKLGEPNGNPNAFFRSGSQKAKLAQERGAVALIEIFESPSGWSRMSRFFGRPSTGLKAQGAGADLPNIWISSETAGKIFADKGNLKIDISKKETKELQAYNVAAILEGSDPKLKDEYIILSAHFDHVGFGAGAGKVTPEDTIFNGARDNAFGVVAVLAAAESFAKVKPKRSVLFLALNGEEMGLLGSRFYAENPLIPLNKSVFNMNCDGAGYNDTGLLTIIGMDRTGAKDEFQKAAAAFGLKAIDDPAPEQNLFDRSDNVSFAAKGIPAPTYSPGFTAFDAEINKYYHQNLDNPDNIDHNYLLKYAQSYTYAARLIANRKEAPKWIAGDKYEKAYNELYNK